MKILVMTDLHFGARNDDPIILQNQLNFFENVVFPYIEENEIGFCLVLGDTFDKRKIQDIKTFNTVKDRIFQMFVELNVTLFMLIGNHDTYFKNTNNVNSIDLLASMFDNIEVIHKCDEISIDNSTFAMVSWINKENENEIMEFIRKTRADIVCGHFEAKGFEMLPGVKSEHGVDKSDFTRFKRVWSGHYHIPSKQGNFEYIGNPFDTNWSDYGQRKSIVIYDTDEDTVEYLENPYRLYAIIDYTDETVIDNSWKDKIVRVNVDMNTVQDKTKFNLFVEQLIELCYKVDINETDINIDFTDTDEDNTPETTFDKIMSVLDSMECDTVKIEDVKQYFIELHNQYLEQERL